MSFNPVERILGKSIVKDRYGRNNKENLWTKKLDEMHLCGPDSSTVCGRPMLGNNYAEYFPKREKCKECFKE